MKIKYIGDYTSVKLYTFPQYEFFVNKITEVEDKDGEIILKNYIGFEKVKVKTIKKVIKNGTSNI